MTTQITRPRQLFQVGSAGSPRSLLGNWLVLRGKRTGDVIRPRQPQYAHTLCCGTRLGTGAAPVWARNGLWIPFLPACHSAPGNPIDLWSHRFPLCDVALAEGLEPPRSCIPAHTSPRPPKKRPAFNNLTINGHRVRIHPLSPPLVCAVQASVVFRSATKSQLIWTGMGYTRIWCFSSRTAKRPADGPPPLGTTYRRALSRSLLGRTACS